MYTLRPNMLSKARGYKFAYKTSFQGMPINVENRKGSYRRWKDLSGEEGKTKMVAPYGEVKGTLAPDGDAVDVFIGPDKQAQYVYVVRIKKAPDFKEYDEDKCFLGFSSAAEAKKTFFASYDDKRFFESMKRVSVDEFKQLLHTRRGKSLVKALLLIGEHC